MAPIIIYQDGKWNTECMNMVRVQEQDVRQNACEEGIESEDEIKLVTVERNGAISIIKEKA